MLRSPGYSSFSEDFLTSSVGSLLLSLLHVQNYVAYAVVSTAFFTFLIQYGLERSLVNLLWKAPLVLVANIDVENVTGVELLFYIPLLLLVFLQFLACLTGHKLYFHDSHRFSSALSPSPSAAKSPPPGRRKTR